MVYTVCAVFFFFGLLAERPDYRKILFGISMLMGVVGTMMLFAHNLNRLIIWGEKVAIWLERTTETAGEAIHKHWLLSLCGAVAGTVIGLSCLHILLIAARPWGSTMFPVVILCLFSTILYAPAWEKFFGPLDQ